MVKRLINLSDFMYTEENDSTFAEIKITVIENVSPTGSIMIVNRIGVLNIIIVILTHVYTRSKIYWSWISNYFISLFRNRNRNSFCGINQFIYPLNTRFILILALIFINITRILSILKIIIDNIKPF
jgi:hypothetical protein